jgi:hypothetical protein
MTLSLDQLPTPVATAWARLRDEAQRILRGDLVALWAFGGTVFPDRPRRPGDLDTFAVLEHIPDGRTTQALERAHAELARERGVDWDIWYILSADARRREAPPHAFEPGRRETSWAIDRAHLLAGCYVNLYGMRPEELVLAPTWPEIGTALSRELEHLERHVLEGDNDPFEAAYAIWNGCRIVHAIETGNVAISKRSGGMRALEHLPERWHDAIRAADRTYDGVGTPQDEEVLRRAMAPFVVMVRERLPLVEPRPAGEPPRWGGY